MTRLLLPTILLLFTGIYSSLYSQVFLSENFEPRGGYLGGDIPPGWSQEYEMDEIDWQYQAGGHLFNPDSAAEGSYNAYFQVSSLNNERTKLISPAFDLSNAATPRLTFWHVQDIWWFGGIPYIDELRVYYRTDIDDYWKLLKSYTNAEEEWVQHTIYLDTLDLSEKFFLAFEGKTGYGHGTCVDDIQVVEAGYKSREVDTVITTQASTDFIATGSTNNKILQTSIKAVGNIDDLLLQSATFYSLNTNDNDIAPDGVKLYVTENKYFTTDSLIGTTNFSGGEAVFANINYAFDYGIYYLWLAYDIDANATHGHSFDASLPANGLVFSNGQNLPVVNHSPAGNRTIFQTLYYDDFETETGWTLNGFEIATPTGYGGNEGGNPDPSFAISGTKILGTNVDELTNEAANYASLLTDREIYAISPPIDCEYYINSTLRFDRWLNLDIWDDSYIEVSTDSMKTWNVAWESGDIYYSESDWQSVAVDLSDYADRHDSVYVRISVGPTDDEINYSGWNIDNFVLTANFIDYDVAVTDILKPVDGCGHTVADEVTIKVVNLAGAPTPDTIPVAFSFDNGQTFTIDTIFGSLPIKGDTIFTFHKTADLSTGGYVIPKAKTLLESDEFPGNDLYIGNEVFLIPTYPLPFETDFETNDHYWTIKGNELKSWELTKPKTAIFNTAHSGTNAWVTSSEGYYNLGDSSYIESTCFDLTNIEFPVFELAQQYKISASDGGFSIQYSLDKGATWKTVPVEATIWNWYNQTNISELLVDFNDGRGWAGENTSWTISRQQLPAEIAGAPSVKFRVVFATNATGTQDEGVVFDDVKLYEMPSDIGITQIIDPSSACELSDSADVTIELKNFGIDIIEAGTEFYATLHFNGIKDIIDTIVLSSDLAPEATMQYTFSETVNVFKAGSYSFEVEIYLPGDIDFTSGGIDNDTATKTVEVFGMPEYDIGADFGTEQPDTVVLDAGADYTTYTWSDASTNQTLAIPLEGKYYVTVSKDTHSTTCYANDSIEIFLSAKDIQISQILNLDSACSFTNSEDITIRIKNLSLSKTIDPADFVSLKYTINNELAAIDTLDLTVPLVAGDSIDFTFTKKADLSEIGTYSIQAYSYFSQDIDFSNDTTDITFMHFGYPDVELGADTIYTTQADTVILVAQEGFDTYTWNDGSSNDSLPITLLSSDVYKITVNDIWGCGSDIDSVTILTNDLAITNIISAVDYCDPVTDTVFAIEITNIGNDTLMPGDVILAWYDFEAQSRITKNIILTDSLKSDSVLIVTFDELITLSEFKEYYFHTGISSVNDIDITNDTITQPLHVYGYPSFSFPYDTIYTRRTDTLVFDATTENATYLWKDGSTLPTYNVSIPTSFNYWVEVSVNGCSVKDTVQVITRDMTIVGTNLPTSTCALTSTEIVSIDIKNLSNDAIVGGTPIHVSLNVDGTVYSEEIPLSSTLFLGSVGTLYLAQTIDLSTVKKYYITATIINEDVNIENNDTSFTVRSLPQPTPTFEYDTITTARPDTVEIWMRQEYDTYLWQDGSTNSYYQVQNPDPAWYKVTVTQGGGCEGYDSLFIKTYDLRASSVKMPVDACEHTSTENVRIAIKNNGIFTVKAGDPIYVGFAMGEQIKYDTISFAFNLNPDQTSEITLNKKLDASEVGMHTIKAWTNYKYDSKPINDTATYSFSTHGLPDALDNPDTILSTMADTIVLVTRENYPSILWSDATTSTTMAITQTASQLYWVEVEDALGCINRDTIRVFSHDLEIVSVSGLESNCVLNNSQQISLKLTNVGEDIIPKNTFLPFKITLNGNEILDTSMLINNFAPQDTITIPIKDLLDLSTQTINTISITSEFITDANKNNDTIYKTTEAFGYPVASLNIDTLFSARLDTVKLYTDIDFSAYAWSDGSSNDTLYISQNKTKMYSVTVTDINGCSDTDSAMLINNDLALTLFQHPKSNCILTEKEKVEIVIKNTGFDAIPKDSTLTASLFLEGAKIEEKIITLNNDLGPNDTQHIAFDTYVDMSAIGDYNLSAKIISSYNDSDTSNNILSETISAYGYPDFSFPQKEIKTLQADTIVVELPTEYSLVSWTGSTNGDSLLIPNITSAEYYATVENSNGCEANDTIIIIANDLSIDSLLMNTMSCQTITDESVTFRIKNTGNDLIETGDSILIDITFDGITTTEKIVVNLDLFPGSNLEYTTGRTISIPILNSKVIKGELHDAVEVSTNNNIFEETVNVFNDVVVNLNITEINTQEPDTVVLQVLQDFSEYLWSTSATEKSLSVANAGVYTVTVTDANGCQASTSATVKSLHASIGDIISPVTDPELTAAELLQFVLINGGGQPVPAGSKVIIDVNVNSVNLHDEITLDNTLADATAITSNLLLDLSEETTYSIHIEGTIENNGEIISTITKTFSVKHGSYPAIELAGGLELLETSLPYSFNLKEGYIYQWHDGSSENTFDVKQSGMVYVTATNADGYSTIDSVMVNAFDLEISKVLSPISHCDDEIEDTVSVLLHNNSPDTVFSGKKIALLYEIIGNTSDNILLELQEDLLPDSSLIITFTSKLSLPLDRELEVSVIITNIEDINAGNNEIIKTFSIHTKPSFTLFGVLDEVDLEKGSYIEGPEGYISYEWHTGLKNKDIKVVESGLYTLMVTDELGCSASASVTVNAGGTSINLKDIDISIYPTFIENGLLFITSKLNTQKANVKIIDSDGKVVEIIDEILIENQSSLNIEKLSSGYYTVMIYTGDKIFTQNIIVK